MNTGHLISCLTTASLLVAASNGVRVEAAQHGDHGNDPRGPLPEAVREATERFRKVSDATAAGYVQFQGCVSGPVEGAMGVHYANFALFDDVLDVEHPEVLVYEPKNGRLQLVATEYVVPADAWDPVHDPSDKPQLMGHLLHFAPGPNRYGPAPFYELHVWAWKDNPQGSFADWNRKVSCDSWAVTP